MDRWYWWIDSKTTTGSIAQTTNVLVPFTVGETIAPPSPSTVTGTVVKVYDDPLVPDHSFVEYTVAIGVIAAGDTITGATSGSNADVLTVKNRAGGKIIAKGDGDWKANLLYWSLTPDGGDASTSLIIRGGYLHGLSESVFLDVNGNYTMGMGDNKAGGITLGVGVVSFF